MAEEKPAEVAVTVELDGKVYTIPSDVPSDEIVAAMWQRLCEQQHDPIKLLADQYDRLKGNPTLWAWVQKQAEPAVQEFFRTGGQRTPTKEEMLAQIDAPDNLVWVMSYLLRKNHPEITEEQAMRMLVKVRMEELKQLRDAAAKVEAGA